MSQPNPVTGVIHVTGEPDTGKTSFALSSGAMPEETVFIDDDVKGKQTVQQIKSMGRAFGVHIDLTDLRKGKTEIRFHEAVMDRLSKIERNKHKALIWDTWTFFERTIHPYVVKNEKMFRETYAALREIHGAQQWQVADSDYEPTILNDLLQIAPLVILVAHVKEDRIDGKKIPGRYVSEVRQAVIKKSVMRVYLRHSAKSQAPIGLIMKRLNKWQVTEDGMQPIAVLPRRIEPFTWKRVLEFWNDPVGDRQLTAEEMPNEYEESILQSTLTPDQKEMLRMFHSEESDSATDFIPSQPTLTDEQRAQALALHAEQGPRACAEYLTRALGKEITRGDLTRILPELNE